VKREAVGERDVGHDFILRRVEEAFSTRKT